MRKSLAIATFFAMTTIVINIIRTTLSIPDFKLKLPQDFDFLGPLPETINDEHRAEDPETPRNRDKPLNILLFYPDDWRHDSIGAENSVVKTPFLDDLAKEGVRFTHNCVTTSVCWVSRATLFTGQYLSRHKSKLLSTPKFCEKKNWRKTWPSLLKRKKGYHIGHIGKWQYHNNEFVHERYADYSYVRDGFHWIDADNGESVHAIDMMEKKAFSFLRERPKDKPFALTVAFYPPKAMDNGHDNEPLSMDSRQYFPKNEDMYKNETIPEPPQMAGWKKLPHFFDESNQGRIRFQMRFGTPDKYQASMKNYYALITEVDACMKKIVRKLSLQGILDETLIIFTTDNGYFHAEHGLAGKWYPYQESIRVPLIIRDPRMPINMKGTLNDDITLNIDLASTILGAANLASPSVMQGRDIADLYMQPKEERKPWREEFYYEHHLDQLAHTIPMSSALVRKNYKYVRFPDWNTDELFDLVSDPLEHDNIIDKNSSKLILEEMRLRYKELQESVK
eukprot:CAMPEP_0194304592 /NCGR_PEP_ID=MMETSP0171-20130528/2305_1 /TAXON_ID=218684 /ORGANISM="Corethron pennatum, Strain L29A3" /LENGTH=506 /DNA_ID=CAMNT_0039055923 /DNA_START=205 /DNA_END=1725 /DNA_ORIENTATION=-